MLFAFVLVVTVSCQSEKGDTPLPLGSDALTRAQYSVARIASNGNQIAPPPLLNTVFKDASGKVTIKIFKSSRAFVARSTVRVAVEPDFVCIGGGGFVDRWSNSMGGGYINESRPVDGNFREWVVSASHVLSFECFWFTAYATGIKVEGVTPAALREKLRLFSTTSGNGANSAATVNIPSNFKLIGGGARSNSASPLTASMPYGDTWYSEIKGTGNVSTFAIGIEKTSMDKWGLSIKQFGSTSPFPQTGLSSHSVSSSSGHILCGIGGRSLVSSSAKRGLVCLYLENGQLGSVITKDYEKAFSGVNTITGMGIRKL